jgi:5-methylcytosine-specific restriction endonuclease McrA
MHGGPSRYSTKYRCPKPLGQCHYCGRPATSWDHIVPKSKGGPGTKDNLVEACQPCNRFKADKAPTCLCPKCRKAARTYLKENND